MGDKRKLLAEVERTMKKVDEGVELFDEIWQKVHDATTPALKDKYEQDLKKEIKKLQRLRDQIKSWISAGNDIRDKDGLVDKRKLIESKMEAFKEVERETKTKNYSKEGLLNSRLDPREKEKQEIREWVQEGLENMAQATELLEAERDELAAAVKKKKSDKPKQTKLEKTLECVESVKLHTRKFEGLLRMLDNNLLDVDAVKDIKDVFEEYLTELKEGECKDINYIYDALAIEDIPEISAEGGMIDSSLAEAALPGSALSNKENISSLPISTGSIPLASAMAFAGSFASAVGVVNNSVLPHRDRAKLSEKESSNSTNSTAAPGTFGNNTTVTKDAGLPTTRGSTPSSISTSPSPPPSNGAFTASVEPTGTATYASQSTPRRKSGSQDHDQPTPAARSSVSSSVSQGKTFASTFSSALTGNSAVPPAPKTPFGMPGSGKSGTVGSATPSVIHGYAAVAAQGVQKQQQPTMPTLAQAAAHAAANVQHNTAATNKLPPSPYSGKVPASSHANDVPGRTSILASATDAAMLPTSITPASSSATPTSADSFLSEHGSSKSTAQPSLSSGFLQAPASVPPLDTAPALHASSRRTSIPDNSTFSSSNFAHSVSTTANGIGTNFPGFGDASSSLRLVNVTSPGAQQLTTTLTSTPTDYLQQQQLRSSSTVSTNSFGVASVAGSAGFANMKPEVAAALLAAKYNNTSNNSASLSQASAEASAVALAQAFAATQQRAAAGANSPYALPDGASAAPADGKKQADSADAAANDLNLAAARILKEQQQLQRYHELHQQSAVNAPSSVPDAVVNGASSPNNNSTATTMQQRQQQGLYGTAASSSALSPVSTSSSAAAVSEANNMLTRQREFLAAKKSAEPQSLRITAAQAINPLGMTQPDKDLIVQHSLIDSAINNLPSNSDLDRMRPLPRMPTPSPTTYTKQVPLTLQAMKWYEDTAENATLFWVFYMCPGTLAQYMAAYALKQKAWRYHTKLRAWFQRLEEPKLIMQEYEKGNFRYFDVEMWKEQIKKDFVFEYSYLEDYRLDIADPYNPPRYVIPLMDSMAAPLPASMSSSNNAATASTAASSSGSAPVATSSSIFSSAGGV